MNNFQIIISIILTIVLLIIIKKIYFSFGGDIWKIDFAMWWYIRARYQFSVHVLKNPEVKEIFYLSNIKINAN